MNLSRAQNNESEALRSWRSALDNIYYFNAYKMSPAYRPKTETEAALQESLTSMERQCKERVDILDKLRKSREEDGESPPGTSSQDIPAKPIRTTPMPRPMAPNGQTSVAAAMPTPPSAFQRPSLPPRPTSQSSTTAPRHHGSRAYSVPQAPTENKLSRPSAERRESRTPSPGKTGGGMLKKTLRPDAKESTGTPASRLQRTMRPSKAPAAAKAATLAWPAAAASIQLPVPGPAVGGPASSAPDLTARRAPLNSPPIPQPRPARAEPQAFTSARNSPAPPPKPLPIRTTKTETPLRPQQLRQQSDTPPVPRSRHGASAKAVPLGPPEPPVVRMSVAERTAQLDAKPTLAQTLEPLQDFPSYRKEYKPTTHVMDAASAQALANELRGNPKNGARAHRERSPVAAISQRAVGLSSPPGTPRRESNGDLHQGSSSENDGMRIRRKPVQKRQEVSVWGGDASLPTSPTEETDPSAAWDARVQELMKNLPRGVDESAAKAIFNEIVIKGDEVHWDDVAGLDIAKNALKEAVVYPFLRPDLFMGLREPARGMLLFGPPGTGKTMLARAVATESKSTFFAISASSLTSKFLGESEKLVRALFGIAKALTPSIIFVDEIDSLLSSRSGSGEHEATRRIKTEFLIQWSDLAKAAAGRDDKNDGDASRVLVLAATNLPWAIDEAARRRFVRRQYIPLPEDHVREQQLRRLMSAQKHGLTDDDFLHLVSLTDGKRLSNPPRWEVTC